MRKRGEGLDPGLVGVAGLTLESESPAKGSGDSLDWLQELEGQDFDFDSLNVLLSKDIEVDGSTDTIQEPQEGGGFESGMSWTDLLTWPEDNHSAPT